MVWKERLAEMRRSLEVRQEVVEELVRIGPASIPIFLCTMIAVAVLLSLLVVPLSLISMRVFLILTIIEYDYFVNTENGSSAGYLTGEGGLEIVGLGTDNEYMSRRARAY